MKILKKVCVFCGGKSGNNPIFEKTAYRLGEILAQNKLEVVYGAGGTGLMKAVADGTKDAGGRVTGMTIQHLYEIERPDLMTTTLDEIKVYSKMFARKVAMTDGSDAFVILPGGLGTLDELFELMVLRQIGIMDKPMILVNINNFFDPMKQMLTEMSDDGFIKPEHLSIIKIIEDVEDVIVALSSELEKIA